MSDLDLMFTPLRKSQIRISAPNRLHCDPDRDNLALIMSMAAYVRDALAGVSGRELARRRALLRDSIAAAHEAGMLSTIADPLIDEMMSAVDGAAAERQFSAATDAFAQDKTDLPIHPTPIQVAAGLEAGARSRKAAARIWQAMAGALAGSAR
ncbi:hypothetical protein FW320_06605 [Azospirillum sp. Vi22]|uniref:hypothetical protein n=1 Tax=Azospirillum baldaniorum TaxID=1064539 RepID=UPI00157A9AB8|nr:hypothetical protein [Azospirillum baldaniorum]NUB05846.1 hypothetical protein [Azospirillum baldaniorum]